MASQVQTERRRFHLLSWTGALLVLAILAAANFILTVIPIRLDTSAGRAYSVTPATRNILSKLEDTVLIRVVFSRELPAVYKLNERYLSDLLSEYRRASRGKIRVEVFDPGATPKNRELAIDYGVVPVQLDVMERDRREVAERFMGVAFFYGDKTEAIPFVQDVQNLEYEITVRIKKLIDPAKPVLGFVSTGGAENINAPTLEPMRRPLEDRYEIRSIDALSPIPPDVRVLWWMAPVQASTPAAVANINAFLRAGGSVGIMADTHQVNVSQFRVTPVAFDWAPVLSEWGISVNPGIVVDPRCDRIQIRAVRGAFQMINVVDYPYFPLVTALNRNHPAARAIDAVSMPFVSALEYKDGLQGLRYSSLADSSHLSYIDENPMMVSPLDDRIRPPDAPAGPFHLAVLAEGKFGGGDKEGRLAVFGTSRFIRSEYPMRPTNYDFFFNFTDWLAQDEALLSIRSKGFSRRPLRQMGDGARIVMKLAAVVVLPILTLLTGLVVWRRQRTRRARVAKEYATAQP